MLGQRPHEFSILAPFFSQGLKQLKAIKHHIHTRFIQYDTVCTYTSIYMYMYICRKYNKILQRSDLYDSICIESLEVKQLQQKLAAYQRRGLKNFGTYRMSSQSQTIRTEVMIRITAGCFWWFLLYSLSVKKWGGWNLSKKPTLKGDCSWFRLIARIWLVKLFEFGPISIP